MRKGAEKNQQGPLFCLELEASCLQWSFLLTVDNFQKDTFFLLTVGSFLLIMELFYLQLTIWAFLLTVGACLLIILALLLTVGAFLLTVGKCV